MVAVWLTAKDLDVRVRYGRVELSSQSGLLMRDADTNAVLDLATKLENAAFAAQTEKLIMDDEGGD